MSELDALYQQKKDLEAQIEDARKRQRDEDLKTVRRLCKAHGFTYNMLKMSLAKGRTRKPKK